MKTRTKLPFDYKYKNEELVAVLSIKNTAILMKKYKNSPSMRLAYQLGRELKALQVLSEKYENKETFAACKRLNKFIAGANFFLFKYVY